MISFPKELILRAREKKATEIVLLPTWKIKCKFYAKKNFPKTLVTLTYVLHVLVKSGE